MRSCVRHEIKNCFRGLNTDKETIENASQKMVDESLPDEDANVCIFFDRSFLWFSAFQALSFVAQPHVIIQKYLDKIL